MRTVKALVLGSMLSIPFLLSGVGAEEEGPRGDMFMAAKPSGAYHADRIIGSDVHSRTEDAVIGAVRDLILDEDGQVVGVVVGVGGFLGIGAKEVAIDWDAVELRHDEEDEEYSVHVDADEATLEEAPEYEHDDSGLMN